MAETNNWDWNEMEEKAGGSFSPLADLGFHTAKVETVDVRQSKNGTYWLHLIFVDDGVKFPDLSHAISFNNDNWRRVHFMRMLKELGIPEEKAKQAIQLAEGKKGQDNIVAAYYATFERAVQKHPEIEIEVFEDTKINSNTGKPYLRTDFKNPNLAFGRGGKKEKPVVSPSSIKDEGEELDLDEIPFN